jgi:hypothetical protein
MRLRGSQSWDSDFAKSRRGVRLAFWGAPSMSGLMWRRKLLPPASKTDTTWLFSRDAGLFVREEINQRLFRIRQRVRGIRIGGRRGGSGRTGCRGCAG